MSVSEHSKLFNHLMDESATEGSEATADCQQHESNKDSVHEHESHIGIHIAGSVATVPLLCVPRQSAQIAGSRGVTQNHSKTMNMDMQTCASECS